MSVWLREIVGWLLLGTGVAVFGLCYLFLANKRILEAAPLTFIGFVVFRGGLHLIKVASAAKACRDAVKAERPKPGRGLLPARAGASRPGEPAPAVLPGPNGPARRGK